MMYEYSAPPELTINLYIFAINLSLLRSSGKFVANFLTSISLQ